MTHCRLVHATALPVYDLGVEHPFSPERQKPLFDLMRTHGLVEAEELFLPPAATRDELLTAHSAEYVDFLRAISADPHNPSLRRQAPVYGLGTGDNPIAANQHEAASTAAGGTLACVREVLSGKAKHAFNSTGGLHHAMPSAASGFCLYNDLVVGIRAARAEGARVVYIDYDVHHGDGVEFAFRDDPNVLTISFHETPEARWPYTGRVADRGEGEGRGSVINFPFASHTTDTSWQVCVETVLRTAVDKFAPDLLLTQHGCDPHYEDPLAQLKLTTASFNIAAKLSRELAKAHCQGRWVATGGGGYQPYRVLPRAWAMVWAVMSDRELPGHLDAGWRERWQPFSSDPMPELFFDPAFVSSAGDAAAAINAATLEQLMTVLD